MINKRKDGSLYTEAQTITPVRGEHGEISHFIAIKQDITDGKAAEEALREANDTLEAVIQASPMGITILDSDGNVKLWNPAAERIFGWRQEEVTDRPLPIIPPEKREEHREFRERVLRDEAFADVEVIRQRKDGSLIDISLSRAPLRDANGDICGIMGIMADITERTRAEEQSRKVARARMVLSQCNEVLVRALDEAALLGDICRIIVEVGGYRLVWVGFAEQDEMRTVRPVARGGACHVLTCPPVADSTTARQERISSSRWAVGKKGAAFNTA